MKRPAVYVLVSQDRDFKASTLVYLQNSTSSTISACYLYRNSYTHPISVQSVVVFVIW